MSETPTLTEIGCVGHSLTGFCRETGRLSHKFTIPDEEMPLMRALAHVEPDDADVIGSYPLDNEEAQLAVSRLNLSVKADRFDWFLEPCLVDLARMEEFP